jgi:hypothetical protein
MPDHDAPKQVHKMPKMSTLRIKILTHLHLLSAIASALFRQTVVGVLQRIGKFAKHFIHAVQT